MKKITLIKIYIISCIIVSLLHIILINFPYIKIELSAIDTSTTEGLFEFASVWAPFIGMVILLILNVFPGLIYEDYWKKVYRILTILLFLILSIITILFSINFLNVYIQENPYDFFNKIPEESILFVQRGFIVFLFYLLIGFNFGCAFILGLYFYYNITGGSSYRRRPLYRRRIL